MKLTDDPIPPEVLRQRLQYVAENVIDTGTRNSGQTWLARKVGVSPRTVRNWVSGRNPLEGPTAELVRMFLEDL